MFRLKIMTQNYSDGFSKSRGVNAINLNKEAEKEVILIKTQEK